MKEYVHNDRVWDFSLGEDVMSVHEVADRLGIGVNQAYAACKKGDIPNMRFGKRYIIPRAAYLNWMATCGGQLAKNALKEAINE
jgi:excisionase family DNA binding protein|tara:strand:- start:2732 stop:2983 length:252 start_codon:yes stop_codon:yes gene_type:complete